MTTNERPRLLICGCGYTGTRLAREMSGDHEVLGCVSSPASVDRLAAVGVRAVVADLDTAADWPIEPRWLRGALVVHMVPPPADGADDPRTARLLALLREPPARLAYLSTTGVYGDRQGDPVTETTPIQPSTARGRRRADAEAQIAEWSAQRKVRWVVLRVPGIYGPGRLPIERLRRGEPVLDAADAGAGNRIHVDDLVAACRLVMAAPNAAGIYNVGDGNPASTSEYFTRVAELAGLSVPPSIPLAEARNQISAQMLSFLTESRRVAIDRIRRELGFSPRYADLDAGIRASLEAQI